MTLRHGRRVISMALVLGAVLGGVLFLRTQDSRAQQAAAPVRGNPPGEWRFWGADAWSTRYSPLDQINAANFNDLTIAWRFKTDNLGPRPEFKLEGTPGSCRRGAARPTRCAWPP